MAGFSHPDQEGGPGLVIAARQGGSGEFVRATDIPPIGCDPPDEPQTRGGLQRGRPAARTGCIEASLFILLGRPARFVWIGDSCGSSSIPRHEALIPERSLSDSVVTRRDLSLVGKSRYAPRSPTAATRACGDRVAFVHLRACFPPRGRLGG